MPRDLLVVVALLGSGCVAACGGGGRAAPDAAPADGATTPRDVGPDALSDAAPSDAAPSDAAPSDAALPDDAGTGGRIVQLTAGGDHTCARRDTGTVACWGSNTTSQRGIDVAEAPLAPNLVPGLPGRALDIAAGGYHTCAALESGQVWCWGANDSGQSDPGASAPQVAPRAVAGVLDAIGVAAGSSHSCALRGDGTVWCWGATDPSSSDVVELPRAVEGLADAVAIGAGLGFTCARTRPGRVWCWGENILGQLGAGTDASGSRVPQPVVGIEAAETLGVGSAHGCATQGGEVFCWGTNDQGELGREPPTAGAEHLSSPVRVEGVTDVLEVAAGGADRGGGHTCARRSLELLCWGGNLEGQTGARVRATRQAAPWTIALAAAGLALGGRHTCALDAGSRVLCWGDDSRQQLGVVLSDGNVSTAEPQEVPDIP